MDVGPVNLDYEVDETFPSYVRDWSVLSKLVRAVDRCFKDYMVSNRHSKSQVLVFKSKSENISVMSDLNLFRQLETSVVSLFCLVLQSTTLFRNCENWTQGFFVFLHKKSSDN